MEEQDALVLRLPFPPPLNNLYVNVPRKGRVKSKRYLTWLRAAENALLYQRTSPRPMFFGPVAVSIQAGKPDNRRRDIDGVQKALFDRLTGIAYADDSQIVKFSVEWADVDGAVVTVRAA